MEFCSYCPGWSAVA
ncbi:hypothetical protein AAY473_030797 [Plecturocebus cupreus]